jgi:hypothetical protein
MMHAKQNKKYINYSRNQYILILMAMHSAYKLINRKNNLYV